MPTNRRSAPKTRAIDHNPGYNSKTEVDSYYTGFELAWLPRWKSLQVWTVELLQLELNIHFVAHLVHADVDCTQIHFILRRLSTRGGQRRGAPLWTTTTIGSH